MSEPTIGVIGGGAWGTALAQTMRLAGRETLLWARNAEVVSEINASHRNTAYLPDVQLDPGLRATQDPAPVAARDIVLVVTPAQQLRSVGKLLAAHVRPGTPLVICCKGIELSTGKAMVDVLAEVVPGALPAVLSGPSFAADVVRGLPAAVTLACADRERGEMLAGTLGYRAFRIYWTDDVAGVEMGGALKNVLAIAAGILDGRRLGASAHAALVTRGFAEMRRFARVAGGRPETLLGLSGLGDLLLTCSSPQSRNMSLGRALGEGRTLAEILAGRRSVSEGVDTARAVAAIAARNQLDMPITAAVAAIVDGKISVDAAIEGLLARPFKPED
jgi:glycerol-3-phosphate dehydrogenase (NAD(P)+)